MQKNAVTITTDEDAMERDTVHELITKAKNVALTNKCCTYSGFTVGAALMDSDGIIYPGINIENQGIQSICAERTAFARALTEGAHDFRRIAVVGKRLDAETFSKTLPCGYCRQFMCEYGGPDLEIITEENGTIYTYKLKDLLPEAFLDF